MIDLFTKNANILIVDDKQSNIDVLEGLLENKGYTNFKSTTDSRLVVSLFESFKPDLILLDLMMPNFNGFQVMEQLKAISPNTYLPVLVLTADITPETKQRALAGGAKDFLAKPFDLIEIELRIKNLLTTRYLHQQLNNQNQILEEKVMQRTAELEKTNIELIIARVKAEESNRLKTNFLNNISHEIRTPFNGLLGFLSLIQDDELDHTERDEYIEIINKSALRLMQTINDIVEISQIQAGITQPVTSKTNIQKLISNLYNHYSSEAEKNGLKFYLINNLPNNIEFTCTDDSKLNSILSAMLGNAIKFTKTGSVEFGIDLEGAHGNIVETQYITSLQQLQFSVKDTGVGIPEDKLESIFEKFMQADGSNTRHFEGSGLGLAIAKAYAEMLGGTISVESEEGKGSIFCFTIPYISESEKAIVIKDVVPAERSERKDLKVLVVEDDEASELLAKIAVKIFSKEIITVRTGVEAVETCRNNPDIDLVLMDIKLPLMDGFEATRQIRQFNKDVIIIAQTAYALVGDREKSIKAGCNDYISKPINQAELLSLIQKYFN